MLNHFVLGKPLWLVICLGSAAAFRTFRTQVGGSARTSVGLQEDRGWPRKEVPPQIREIWGTRLAVWEKWGYCHSDRIHWGWIMGCMIYIYICIDIYIYIWFMIYIWSIYDRYMIYDIIQQTVWLFVSMDGALFPVCHSESVEPWCHALCKTSKWRPSWLKNSNVAWWYVRIRPNQLV